MCFCKKIQIFRNNEDCIDAVKNQYKTFEQKKKYIYVRYHTNAQTSKIAVRFSGMILAHHSPNARAAIKAIVFNFSRRR